MSTIGRNIFLTRLLTSWKSFLLFSQEYTSLQEKEELKETEYPSEDPACYETVHNGREVKKCICTHDLCNGSTSTSFNVAVMIFTLVTSLYLHSNQFLCWYEIFLKKLWLHWKAYFDVPKILFAIWPKWSQISAFIHRHGIYQNYGWKQSV